jgi:hypothetical protein
MAAPDLARPRSIAEFADYLISLGMATPDTIVGCSAEHISEIRRVQDVDLPAQYEQFLLAMGQEAGALLVGTDFFYPFFTGIPVFVEGACELLAENNAARMVRPGSVFIGLHQGVELYWLEQGDPSGPAHWYQDGAGAPKMSWPTLLDFLVWQADHQHQIRSEIRQSRLDRLAQAAIDSTDNTAPTEEEV